MIWVMFTSSQAIQQSHFFRAESSWAIRISTVTQQSRYGCGSAGNSVSRIHPHSRATRTTDRTASPRSGQLIILTFRFFSFSALRSSSRGWVQR